MSIPIPTFPVDTMSYHSIEKIDFIEDYINDVLAERKQNTKENVFRLLRKNFPTKPPKPMVDFTYAFVRDIVEIVGDDDKDLLNNKNVWVRDTKIYNIAVVKTAFPVEILTYDGPFDWQFLKRYYYKLYMTFYNDSNEIMK